MEWFFFGCLTKFLMLLFLVGGGRRGGREVEGFNGGGDEGEEY